MPRRSSGPAATLSTQETSSVTPSHLPPDNITVLRSQWKWAAFSQFFYTFNDVLAVNNVSLGVRLGIPNCSLKFALNSLFLCAGY